jgi:UDP-glucose:(heptosyl)LPS alpha-1,3-glucosyltransferase
MKIALAYLEYSRRGGIERHSVELAEGLAGRGHEVHFYGASAPEQPRQGVTFHRVLIPPFPNSLRVVAFAARGGRALAGERDALTISAGPVGGADVVVAHSCHAAGRSIPAAREMRSKGRRNWGIADAVRLRMERQVYGERRYRRVVAVSEGVARELQTFYQVPAADIDVIPNGVDINEFHPRLRETSGAAFRRTSHIPADHSVLLFVGNEFRRKGLDLLIDALGRLRGERWSLVVAGDDEPGPFWMHARRLGIDSRIQFLGAARDMASVYAAADWFVLPTAYEAWPLAMGEAAASGVPLLMTKVNGTEDFLVNGENGFFITPSAGDLAGTLSMCMNNQDLRLRLSARARSRACEFTWERTVNAFSELLGRLSSEVIQS